MVRLSAQLATALEAVAAGRVQYGNLYPKMARKRPHGSTIDWLLDGYEVYGGEHSTYSAAATRGLIVARFELLPTVHVPEQIQVNDVAASLDEVAWSRKTVEAMIRDELKSHGWQRSWFVGDYVSDDFIEAVRERVVEVYPEAVGNRAGEDGRR